MVTVAGFEHIYKGLRFTRLMTLCLPCSQRSETRLLLVVRLKRNVVIMHASVKMMHQVMHDAR